MDGWYRVIVVKQGAEIFNQQFPEWAAANHAHVTLEEEHKDEGDVSVQLWTREA